MLEELMRRPRYALSPLLALREKKVQEAARALAARVADRVRAENDRLDAAAKRETHEAAAARVREGEARALAQGELRAVDLARADAWEVRVAAERAAIVAEVERAAAREAKAVDDECGARRDTIGKQADADVVRRDRVRWSDRLHRRADAAQEEAASEAWRPKTR